MEIGLSKTAVNGWKHGRTNPTDATAQRIAKYFDITVAELMSDNETNPAPETGNELTEMQQKAMRLIMEMSDEQLRVFIATLKAAMGE